MNTTERYVNLVCDYIKVRKEDVLGKSRKGDLPCARQWICYLLKENTDLSLSKIAEAINSPSHCATLHGVKMVKNFLEVDKTYRIRFKGLIDKAAILKKNIELEQTASFKNSARRRFAYRYGGRMTIISPSRFMGFKGGVMDSSGRRRYSITRTALTIMLLLVSLSLYAPSGPESDPDTLLEDYFINYAPLNRETLKEALIYSGITSHEVVLAQGRLETGNFTSDLCLQYNNLFGMKMPRVRSTTASNSTENGYAVYQSWYHCVLDMKKFQEYYSDAGRCLEDYFSFLKSIGYAEDPLYITKLAELCSI